MAAAPQTIGNLQRRQLLVCLQNFTDTSALPSVPMPLWLSVLFFCFLAVAAPLQAGVTKPADGERLLLIRAAGGGGNAKEQPAQGAVYDSMVEYLTEHGYRVVDRAAAEQASIQIAATHEIDPLLNKAAAYGLKFLAEYTIHFKTATLVKDPDKGIGALVRISAKIVDNTGARIITAKHAEASSTGYATDDAIEKAARTAGKKLTEQLTTALERHVAQLGAEGRTLTMVFDGQEAQAARISALLEKSPAVAAIKEVECGGGKTTVEIISRVRRDQLERDMLKLVSLQGITLSKIRSEGNRSTWKIK